MGNVVQKINAVIKQGGRLPSVFCRTWREHCALQKAVEGTDREVIQVALALTHSTTLLKGSAAYSLQDTLHHNTYCSNHGMPQLSGYLIGWKCVRALCDCVTMCVRGTAANLARLAPH